MLIRLAKLQTACFHALRRGDRGATAVEYGLLVALIAAIIVGTISTLGGKINDAFSSVNSAV